MAVWRRELRVILNLPDILDGAIANATWGVVSMVVHPRNSRRVAADLDTVSWADTDKLIKNAFADIRSDQHVPDMTEGEAAALEAAVMRDEVQAALQALLACRLTDAPEADAAKARAAVNLALGGVTSPGSTLRPQQPLDYLWDEARENGDNNPFFYIEQHAQERIQWFCRFLSDKFDERIAYLVGTLEGRVGFAGLSQVRSEAFSSRLVSGNARIEALLGSLDRQLAALTEPARRSQAEMQFIDRYRRQVHQRHGFLIPPDFDRRRRVAVEDIYVSVGIAEMEFSGRAPSVPRLYSERLKVWDLTERIGRTVLLGDPGGGKTTAANALTARFADDSTNKIPFLITLREYAAKTPVEWSIVEFIEHILKTLYQSPASDGLVEGLLLTGRAVVIFDGLDELLDTSRRRDVSDRVEQFCTAYPLTPVLVTSRVVGYEQARLDDSQFACYKIDNFSDDDVAEYAQKWFTAQEGIAATEAEAKAAAFLMESSSAKDLRSNPLLLALMCILYRAAGSLPRDRAGVYAKCAELLLRKWDEQRELYTELDSDYLVQPTLRYLAWWLFTREDSRTTATERELVTKAAEFLHGRGYDAKDEAQAAARKFVNFCRGRMWVFSDVGTSADGEQLYQFTHRTFLEYFTAFHLAASADTPEDLATALSSHIAGKGRYAGEGWYIVAELAIQIKNSVTEDGADRIFRALLKLWSAENRRFSFRILYFICRCIGSTSASPATVKTVAQSACENSFNSNTQSLVELISNGGRHTAIITEEIWRMTARRAENPEQLEDILHFLMYTYALYEIDWSRRTKEQALIAFSNLGRAIYDHAGESQISWTDADWWEHSGFQLVVRLLSCWSEQDADRLANLGLMSLTCLIVEMYTFDRDEFLRNAPAGQANSIYSYLSKRLTGHPSALPDLPVPEEFETAFAKWAAGEKDFLDYIPIE